jgi:hypothetical protein
MRPHISAIVADVNGHIAYHRYVMVLTPLMQRLPLLIKQILCYLNLPYGFRFPLKEIFQSLFVSIFKYIGPFNPALAIELSLQNHKKGIIIEPLGLGLTKALEVVIAPKALARFF